MKGGRYMPPLPPLAKLFLGTLLLLLAARAVYDHSCFTFGLGHGAFCWTNEPCCVGVSK